MNWPAFWKWVVFSLIWGVLFDRVFHLWPALVVSLGALLGYATLLFWDAWRWRRDQRELAERTRKRFETEDQS